MEDNPINDSTKTKEQEEQKKEDTKTKEQEEDTNTNTTTPKKDTEEKKKEDPPKDPEYISTIDFVIRDLMKKFGSVFSDGSHVVDGIRAGFKEPQRYFRKDGNLNDRTYYDEMIKTIRESIDEIAKNPLNLPSQVKLEGVSQEELDNFMKTYGKMPLPLGSSSSPDHPHIKYCDDPEKKKKDKAANTDNTETKPDDKLETNTGNPEATPKTETPKATPKADDQTPKANTDLSGGQGYKKRHSRKKRKERKQRQSKRRLTQTHADSRRLTT